MELRLYQEKFIKSLSRALTKCKRIVAQLATGGGKTVIFSGISFRYIAKANKPVLILVHRKELLQQTRKTAFNSFELSCTPIVAGMKFIPDSDIYVGMVESVSRRLDKLHKIKPNIGLLIIDECHRLEFIKVKERAEQLWPGLLVIGFSATPVTAVKKKPLKNYYDDIVVCQEGIPELIKDGWLSQNLTWCPKETVDRLKLTIKGGEFDEQVMGTAFSRPKYINNTVTAYESWAKDTKTIIFNVNVFHSIEVEKAFIEAGYNCKHLDGETPKHKRDQILHWFKVTPDAILCNVGIATTGFDEATIETVIINKATMSMPLWIQMTGRGSRAIDVKFIHENQAQYPYPLTLKNLFSIIDMGGNAIIHGDWSQHRDWERLFHNPPKPGTKEGVAPIKICPSCDAVIPAAARVCPFCGFEFKTETPAEIDLHEFIIVTKDIDINKIIEENRHRKEYYPFFNIGNILADEAKRYIKAPLQMNDGYAIFILEAYNKLAREWCHKKKHRYNKWHQIKAKEHLFSELQRRFPKWESKLMEDRINPHEMLYEMMTKVLDVEPLKPIK